jgi:hypothetical protein
MNNVSPDKTKLLTENEVEEVLKGMGFKLIKKEDGHNYIDSRDPNFLSAFNRNLEKYGTSEQKKKFRHYEKVLR